MEINHLLHTLRTRELREDEWKSLQQWTSEDPFLQEAIEGLRSIPADTRIGHIHNIIQQLESRQKRTFKLSGMRFWAGAAASILILIVTVLLINNFQVQRATQVALEVPAPPADNHSSVTDASEYTPDDQTTEGEGQASNAPVDLKSESHIAPSLQTMRSESSASHESEPTLYNPEEGLAKHAQPNSAPEINYPAEVQTAAPGSRDMTTDEDRLRMDVTPAVLPEVKGVVLNHLGEPMSGAPIQLKGTQARTQTDYLGNFALDIPLSPTENALVISPAGYAPVETMVNSGDSLIVRLADKKNPASAEITTLAQNRTGSMSRPSGRALASPLIGDRSYNKYLRQNLRYPPKAAEANIHGTVILEFDLNPEGTPISFRIIKSLGYGCDEEAIRLIREGPKWDVGAAQVKMGRMEIGF